ncbi:MAG: peptide deformylase [Candidatus Ancillula sp.]|jgi:peptide deformylase|nr:peptide deformylase [Candidatus Ancillula sp.]
MSFKFNKSKIDRVLSNRVQKLLQQHPNHILPIIQMGDPVLRAECREYKGGLEPELLRKLISAMKITMREAPGVGLAAPQIGLNIAMAVLEDPTVEDPDYDPIADGDEKETYYFPFFVAINPRYEPIEEATPEENVKNFFEGCLSLKDYYAIRPRYHRIKAFWTDEKGRDHEQELVGWPARVFQHETDHLYGEVYIDKSIIRSLTTSDNLVNFEYDDNIEYAQDVLGFDLDYTL